MATGTLRFRTSHITELPTTHIKQAPGFAWVAVPTTGPGAAHDDPSKNWGTANRKRARQIGGVPAQLADLAPGETVTAKQQEKIDRKLRELNSDAAWGRDLTVPSGGKKDGGGAGGGGGGRAGRTTGTKKILASGKTFAHYLDDEEAEIARTGRRDIEMEGVPVAAGAATTAPVQRATTPPPARPIKMPRGKRKPGRPSAAARQQQQLLQEQESARQSGSPAPSAVSGARAASQPRDTEMTDADAGDELEGDDANPAPPPVPTSAEIAALLAATPLTYHQARSAPPPANAPPARRFCEICGYWGRVRCMKCGVMTCSVACKDAHDEHRCLKFYA